MSKVFFELVIDSKPDKYSAINSLLGVTDAGKKGYWGYKIIVDEDPLEISQPTVLLHFMGILEGKFKALLEIGIQRSNIVFILPTNMTINAIWNSFPRSYCYLAKMGLCWPFLVTNLDACFQPQDGTFVGNCGR